MNLRDGYRTFFLKTAEGQAFMSTLEQFIEQLHQLAEKDPDKARDQVQQARGVRQVIEHIQSVTAQTRKSKDQP